VVGLAASGANRKQVIDCVADHPGNKVKKPHFGNCAIELCARRCWLNQSSDRNHVYAVTVAFGDQAPLPSDDESRGLAVRVIPFGSVT
jgi:hypothetical protein